LDDITKQKQNEQKMFDLERLADKGLMAASISHELNNFLGLILAGVEMSQAYLERNRSEDTVLSLEKVKGNISKMIRYTAGLMDYTRLETNKQNANLNEIITDVLSFLAVQRKFSRHSIRTELDSRLPNLNLDSDQIAQLLLNMLNNASDAIIDSKQNNGIIEIRTVRSGDFAVLKISDNGAGMTNDVKEKLFNIQLTTKPGGHGYGLVTCGKIVKNHGGRIEIISQPGTGATFEIYFPLN
jgi:two-component system NtrC family sensor kinase